MHGHTLDNIDGYRVFRTMLNGEVLAERELVGMFFGDTKYGAAIKLAQAHRSSGNYAIVETVYSCGKTYDECLEAAR